MTNKTCKNACQLFANNLKQQKQDHEVYELYVLVQQIGTLGKFGHEWHRDVVVTDYTKVQPVIERHNYPHAHVQPHDFTVSLQGDIAESFNQLVKPGQVVHIQAVTVRPILGVGVVVIAREDYANQKVVTELDSKSGIVRMIHERKRNSLPPTPQAARKMTSGEVPISPVKPIPLQPSTYSFYEADEDDFLAPEVRTPEEVTIDEEDVPEKRGLDEQSAPPIKRRHLGT